MFGTSFPQATNLLSKITCLKMFSTEDFYFIFASYSKFYFQNAI